MNLITFLGKVDKITADMTKEKLEFFIHELARTLPEDKRFYFLSNLEGINSTKASPENSIDVVSVWKEEAERILGKIQMMNSGEYSLDSEINEEYDDWYNSFVNEFLFDDPDGICGILTNAVNFVHRCVDAERYAEGCKVGAALLELDVTDEGDYTDCCGNPLNLNELVTQGVISIDYKRFLTEVCYLAYQANPAEKRAEEIYNLLSTYGEYSGITLESILQFGEELSEINEFLLSTIDFLGMKTGNFQQKLLTEALNIVSNADTLLYAARKYYEVHPSLYLQYIERMFDKIDKSVLLEIGQEALDQIHEDYLVRSEIALLLSRAAVEMGNQKTAENYWLEAFRSDTTVVNYMRLVTEATQPEEYEEEIRNILAKLKRNAPNEEVVHPYRYYLNDELRKNEPDESMFDMLDFFLDGHTEPLWNRKFSDIHAELMLLLLYDYEQAELPIGLSRMSRRAASFSEFKGEKYVEGTIHLHQHNPIEENSTDWFWICLSLWKEKNNVLFSEEEQLKCLKQLEFYIDKATEKVLTSKDRNRYGVCAAFIAALGEVKEYRDDQTKQSFLLAYKEKYPYHRAFHKELREYGMM